MNFAYLDCSSGISGDMMLGALIDLGVPVDLLNDSVQSVLPSVQISSSLVARHGFRAVQAEVHVPHEHVHRTLTDILTLVGQSKLSAKNQRRVGEIFRLIAQAEANVHGTEMEKVHFHEVGAADSIADIVGVVVGIDHLGITEFEGSAIPTGTGTIKIAHGECSIPAPATAELLKGIPLASSPIRFELTTPTGAVLLKYYVKYFGTFPAMTIHTSGVGAGSRNLEEQANVLRIHIGHKTAVNYSVAHRHHHDHVHHDHAAHHIAAQDVVGSEDQRYPLIRETLWVVETNLDDTTGELIGNCVERLWTLSPLDVWTTPIQMKKHRPGTLLSVLCRPEQIDLIEILLFSETSTLGVRRYPVERTALFRESITVQTPWGEMKAKKAFLPDGTEKVFPEFESAKKIADERGGPVWKIMNAVR